MRAPTVSDEAILALHRQGFAPSTIADKLGVWKARVRRVIRKSDALTPLNRKVNRRHARCQERGGCEPSDVYVERYFYNGPERLPVCKRCDVPIRHGTPFINWNGKTRRAA